MKAIRKAVFPVAGLGTRFLPATKAIPKEMLTIVDRPAIQLVVDEAREAGIEHFIFVTGRNKDAIEDYFDLQFELEQTLRARNKTAELALLAEVLPPAGATSFTRQQSPLGLGHAVWCARELVGDEPCAVILPDMLMMAKPGCLKQMVDAYGGLGESASMIAVEEVPADQTHLYGVVGVGKQKGKAFEISGMVEKPPQGKAPSNLHHLGTIHPAAGYLCDPGEAGARRGRRNPAHGRDDHACQERAVLWLQVRRAHYDFGSKLGFLVANVAYALKRDDIAPDFRKELKRLLG